MAHLWRHSGVRAAGSGPKPLYNHAAARLRLQGYRVGKKYSRRWINMLGDRPGVVYGRDAAARSAWILK